VQKGKQAHRPLSERVLWKIRFPPGRKIFQGFIGDKGAGTKKGVPDGTPHILAKGK